MIDEMPNNYCAKARVGMSFKLSELKTQSNMSVVVGGRTHYGEVIGILTLETRFPRIPGDIGNASSYNFPVKMKAVSGATITRVVRKSDKRLLTPFIEGAKQLEAEGVKAITTSCGFLSMFQEEMASAVSIPVFTSALILLPIIQRMLGRNQKVGIITADSSSLKPKHLFQASGYKSGGVVITGLQREKEFSKIDNNELSFRPEKVQEEVVRAARSLVKRNSDVGAILMECTNLPPYSAAVNEATHLPVFDIIHLMNFVYSSLILRRDRFTSGFI